jgi:predicted RecA/RadA family phage recombinase
LVLHFYFSRAATNAPEPSGYTQDEEVVISGTLVGNASSKTVDDQATVLSNQDASPTSGVRWVAGIIVVPSDDYPLYRSASQATATGTSVTPALPAGTTATDVLGNKDLLIATVEGAGSTALSMTDGAWTEIATWDTTTSGGGSTVSKFWAYMSGTLNRQANRTGSGEISAQICTFYNCKQTSPIGAVNVRQNASSTTSTWDALTRSATKTIVQSTCIADGVPTFTSPSGWNERTDGLGISTGDQVFNASGSSASASFTLSTASPTAVGLVEIVGLASVTEHTRSALVDAAGLVSSSATFFSVISRSGSLDTTAAISVSGIREVSRSAAISATGDISSSGIVSTPANTLERSASIDCSGQVDSVGEAFSVLERSVDIGFTGNIDTSCVFFSVIQGSSLIDVTGSIESSSLFFSELSASAAVGVLGSIESVAEFLSIFEVSVAIDGNAQVGSSGLHISERAASVGASADIVVVGQFFSVFERSITLVCVSGIDIAGSSFSILETSASVDGLGEILSSGSVQSDVTEFERTAQLGAVGSINAIGVAPSLAFNPTRLASVAKENRTQPVGTEYRG